MEVHAHTHTARKKWTHYFWEFLMLFLAVFCGFMAENKREHIIESHRAKDYAKGLITDLRNDTAEVKAALHQTAFIITSMDSLHSIASEINKQVNKLPGTFYYYARFTSNVFRVDWNRSSINQLVQSGNLRYIKNKEIVGKINAYYAHQGLIMNQNETDVAHRNVMMGIRNKILKNEFYSIFSTLKITIEEYGHVSSPLVDSLMNVQLEILPDGLKNLDEYLNHLSDRKSRIRPLVETYYPQAIQFAVEIIDMLKKEYHFN